MVERKTIYWILGVSIFIFISSIVFVFIHLSEGYWIKDSRGVWVKHGYPLKLPDYVLAQQQVIVCALNLYSQSSFEEFSSQCLGSCDIYAVDIVHVPRTEEDEQENNQCEAFRRGQLTHFIELDKDGKVVRIK